MIRLEGLRPRWPSGNVVALRDDARRPRFSPLPTASPASASKRRRVRAAGAVPATVGVVDGEIRVGLTETELERFVDARKVGPRDPGGVHRPGRGGATTVGGTLAVARAAGIRFMGTGGLGGVHRGFPSPPPDVSADLGEVARTQALVVSSGSSRCSTCCDSRGARDAGVPDRLARRHATPLLRGGGRPAGIRASRDRRRGGAHRQGHWELGGAALLLGRPPDESLHVDDLIQEAVSEAHARGVEGQAVTPFVYNFLHDRSGGRTLAVNRELIAANAGLAAEIAAEGAL